LHRYLSTRLPDYRYEAHFGGVYYLFLRGMNLDWGANYGIYRDKPRAALIKELSAYFGKIWSPNLQLWNDFGRILESNQEIRFLEKIGFLN